MYFKLVRNAAAPVIVPGFVRVPDFPVIAMPVRFGRDCLSSSNRFFLLLFPLQRQLFELLMLSVNLLISKVLRRNIHPLFIKFEVISFKVDSLSIHLSGDDKYVSMLVLGVTVDTH